MDESRKKGNQAKSVGRSLAGSIHPHPQALASIPPPSLPPPTSGLQVGKKQH